MMYALRALTEQTSEGTGQDFVRGIHAKCAKPDARQAPASLKGPIMQKITSSPFSMRRALANGLLAAFCCLGFTGRAALTYEVLRTFRSDGTGPAYPLAGLTLGTDGNLYGTTSWDGSTNQDGTIFRITPRGAFATLWNFQTNGRPQTKLLQGTDGNLYGTTEGGTQLTVFKFTLSGSFAMLTEFSSGYGSLGPLIEGDRGSLISTTRSAPPGSAGAGYGSVFIYQQQGAFSGVLFFPMSSQNAAPAAGVIRASDGNFYGTTTGGWGKSTIFRLSADGSFTNLFVFGGTNGYGTATGLVQADDGNLYGTSLGGVFRISTNGLFTNLFQFDSATTGRSPQGSLIQGSDGALYGVNSAGGASNSGTIFRITTDGQFTTILSFDNAKGIEPLGGLVQGKDGIFYGTTSRAGPGGGGTIFRLGSNLPPILKPISSSHGTVTLTWTSIANRNYRVEYRTNLTASDWTLLNSAIPGTGGEVSVTDTPGNDAQRFYRVVLIP
jgi:uncharacterized repeat protein (TIGR03803 family)